MHQNILQRPSASGCPCDLCFTDIVPEDSTGKLGTCTVKQRHLSWHHFRFLTKPICRFQLRRFGLQKIEPFKNTGQ